MNYLNVLDVIFILFILAAGIVGMKRGFFKELVMTIGYFLVIIIAFSLKNPLAEFLSIKLPFITFTGYLRGMSVLNIVIYQFIAFIIIFTILMLIFNLLLRLTNIFEKLLNMTIVLGMISKFFGFVLGIVNGVIMVFVVSMFLSIPSFDHEIIRESKVKTVVLEKTPVLTKFSQPLIKSFEDLYDLGQTYKNNENKEEVNQKAIQVMIDNKLITQTYVERLVEEGKLHPSVLN